MCDAVIAFENLLKDVFPEFDSAFHKEVALRLANFAYVWDKYYESDMTRVKHEQEKIVEWINEHRGCKL